MTAFNFKGELPGSKSMLNRALIALSYNPDIKIVGDSDCDDVRLMQQGLADLFSGRTVDCGHAGTVLRFLALRASRIPGSHKLKGSERLFQRPHQELLQILGQLGVDAKWQSGSITIVSRGWRLMVDGLQVNSERSSQFASSVVLNSWGLKSPLHFHVSRKIVSEDYFRMTLKMMRFLGLRIESNGSEFFIAANQYAKSQKILIEQDLSSAFVVAALAAVSGRAEIQNFPKVSLQPDFVFVSILEKMKINIQKNEDQLLVLQTPEWQGVTAHIESSPDLFPVLGVLCALAQSESIISGVGHLQYKESSRLLRTTELIEKLGAQVRINNDQVKINPTPLKPQDVPAFSFDSDQDHRMAMAAIVARQAGYKVNLNNRAVVSKSFPELAKLVEASQ